MNFYRDNFNQDGYQEEGYEIARLICHFAEIHCRTLYSYAESEESLNDLNSNSSLSENNQTWRRKLMRLIKQQRTDIGRNSVNASTRRTKLSLHCVINVICILCRKLREEKAPHTLSLPSSLMNSWDGMFTYVLLFCIFREQPSICWIRSTFQLLIRDLIETHPYDGSDGPVKELFQKCHDMPVVVAAMAVAGNNDTNSLERIDNNDTLSASLESSREFHKSANRTANTLWKAFQSRNSSAVYAHSPFSAFEYQPTPLLLGDSSLDGWSLMHFLASTIPVHPVVDTTASSAAPATLLNRLMDVLLSAGVRLVERDTSGRTPLHVACSVLHVDMILCLISRGASVLLEDRLGQTALQTFLRTMSVCNWRYYTMHSSENNSSQSLSNRHNYKKCTSEQLAQCILALTGHDMTRLWQVAQTDGQTAAEACAANPLVLAVQFGDSVVVKSIVSASKLCSNSLWSADVVRHCVMSAIRAGRAWLVEYLWNSYEVILDSIRTGRLDVAVHLDSAGSIEQWVSFLQICMTAAALSHGNKHLDSNKNSIGAADNFKQKSSVFFANETARGKNSHRSDLAARLTRDTHSPSLAILAFLFRKMQHMRTYLAETSSAAVNSVKFEDAYNNVWAPFLHMAVLKTASEQEDSTFDKNGKATAASKAGLLSAFLSGDCICIHHVLNCLHASKVGGVMGELCPLWLPFAERVSVRSACQLLSPLALAFYMHCNDAAAGLLSFVLVSQKSKPLDLSQCAKMFVSPLVACALSCNYEGLHMLRDHMGFDAFAAAANTPDLSGITPLPALLHVLCEQRREAVASMGVAPIMHSRASKASKYERSKEPEVLSILALPIKPEAAVKTVSLLIECVKGSYRVDGPTPLGTDLTVWEVRREQLQQRIKLINDRIGAILKAGGSNAASIDSAEVIAHLDKLLIQEIPARKDDIFQRIQQSLLAWDRVQHWIGTNGMRVKEGASDGFLHNLRALRSLYTPKLQHRKAGFWGKIVQCLTCVLEREVFGHGSGTNVGASKYAVGNVPDAWRRLWAIIGGQEGSSRSNVTRRLLQLREHLLSFRDPFISDLVSGRRPSRSGMLVEGGVRRVISKETWLLLHRLMPHPAMHFSVVETEIRGTENVFSVRNTTISTQPSYPEPSLTAGYVSPRVHAAFESLHEWLKVVYNDGNILYSGEYELSRVIPVGSTKTENGVSGRSSSENVLVLVVELLSLVEGRTRAEAALQRFPQVNTADKEESALAVLLGTLLQSNPEVSASQSLQFMPLTRGNKTPQALSSIVKVCVNMSNEAAFYGWRNIPACQAQAHRHSAALALAEQIAVLLIESADNSMQLGSARTSASVLRTQFLVFLASCGMWNAATRLLQACKTGTVMLADGVADSTEGGKSYLTGYPTMLAGSRALDEIDYVGLAGLSAEVEMSCEDLNEYFSSRNLNNPVVHGNYAQSGWSWSWARADIFALTEVHPLHFAIRANSADASKFIDSFFATFPDTSLDAMSLALLARHYGSSSESSHGSAFERVMAQANILEVPLTADLQSLYLAHGAISLGLTMHGIRKSRLRGGVSQHLMRLENGHYKPLPDFELACLQRLETAFFDAMIQGVVLNARVRSTQSLTKGVSHIAPAKHRIGSSDGVRQVAVVPQTGGQLQGLCIAAYAQRTSASPGLVGGPRSVTGMGSATGDPSPRIALMDGTSVTYSRFSSSIYSLLRAVPMPIIACGVNQSGYSILHSLGNLSGTTVAQRLLEKGAWRTLAVDADGYTPVHAALNAGNFGLASHMLAQVLAEMHQPEPIQRVYARHSALPVREAACTMLLRLAVTQRKAAEKEYFGRIVHPEETAHAQSALDVISLATRGLNLTTVSSLEDLLLYVMYRAAVAWRHISKQDFSRFLQLSRPSKSDNDTDGRPSLESKSATFPVPGNSTMGVNLDSIVRARALLETLGVSISQLPLSAASEFKNSKARANPLCGLWDSISPSMLQERISVSTASELKSQLLGWYMRRDKNPDATTHKPVVKNRKFAGIEPGHLLHIADELHLRRALNISCVRLGTLSAKEQDAERIDYAEYADWDKTQTKASASAAAPVSKTDYNRYFDKSFTGFGNHLCDATPNDRRETEELLLKRHSSAASQSLMRQLIIETRSAAMTNKYADDYTVSASTAVFVQERAAETEKLLKFIKHWRADASGLQGALVLAYKILDWVRLLYLARTLVFMTSVPSASGVEGSWEHPLQSRYRRWRACVHYELQVKRIVQPPSVLAISTSGAVIAPHDGLRLRICDLLEPEDLAYFFRSVHGASERFDALRDLIIKALVCCCLMLGRDILAAFVGQVRRASAPDADGSPAASTASLLALQLEETGRNPRPGLATLLTMMQKINIPSILNGLTGANAAYRSDCARELTCLAKSMQTFDLDVHASEAMCGLPTVLPVKPKRTDNQSAIPTSSSRSVPGYLSDNKSSSVIKHRFGKLDSNGSRSATDNDPDDRAVNGILPTADELESIRALAGHDGADELNKAYTIANAISWLLQAVAGVASSGALAGGTVGLLAGGRSVAPRDIYMTLGQDWRQPAQLRNPLCLASLPAGILPAFQLQQEQWLGQLSTYRQHRLAALLSAGRSEAAAPAEALSVGSLTGWKLSPYKPLSLSLGFKGEDARLSLKCCLHLLELGYQPTTIDAHGRTPIAVAAILGRPGMLQDMLRYSSDEQLDKLTYMRRYLCWHVLMACPADTKGSSAADLSLELDNSPDGTASAFEMCIRLLRQREFKFLCPCNEANDSSNDAHLSCFELALLKRLKWVTADICEDIQANVIQSEVSNVSSDGQNNTLLSAFGPLHLSTVWPAIPLDLLGRVFDCLCLQSKVSDPLQRLSMNQILCSDTLEHDISLHAHFMAQECGVHSASDSTIATALMCDACLVIVLALESSYSPHARNGVSSDCALWRAARSNVGQLLLMALNASSSISKNVKRDNLLEVAVTQLPLVSSPLSPSPTKRTSRLTPGKSRQLREDALRMRDDVLGTSKSWDLFDLAVSTRRQDVVNLVFRRFRLYGYDASSREYPSPLRLSLLGCFYNCQHVLLAVALYAGQNERATLDTGGILGTRRLLGQAEKLPLAVSRKPEGVTPLEVACLYGHSAILRYLVTTVGVVVPWPLVLDAILRSRVPEEDCLLLLRAYIHSTSAARNILRQEESSTISAAEDYLHLAAQDPAPEVMELRSRLGMPVLSLLDTLPRSSERSSGGSPAVALSGETLMHLCARRGHALLVQFLVDIGVSVYAQDARGFTVLQLAVTFGQSKVTQVLSAALPRLHRTVRWLCVYVRRWLLLRTSRRAFPANLDEFRNKCADEEYIASDKKNSAGGELSGSSILSAKVETAAQRAHREAEAALKLARENYSPYMEK